MQQLLDVFERHGGPVLAVMRMPRAEIGRYGVIAARGLGANVYEVLDLVEKPDPREAPSDLAIVCRYVLTPDLFPILAATAPNSRGEIQLTDGLRTLRGRIDNAWAVHQVETTVVFARRSRVVTWLVGGLNFQIEHHLFPRISHVHYPAIQSSWNRPAGTLGSGTRSSRPSAPVSRRISGGCDGCGGQTRPDLLE
jgi:fatty acid desaturase